MVCIRNDKIKIFCALEDKQTTFVIFTKNQYADGDM